MSLTKVDNQLDNIPSEQRFFRLVEMANANKSESSQRVYLQTYKRWLDHCQERGLNEIELYADEIIQFIETRDTTKTTRQRELSAMRQLIDLLSILYPNDQGILIEQALLKRHKIKGIGGTERQHQALTPEMVIRARDSWKGDKPSQLRNYAIFALIFATGLRATELVSLKWTDINLVDGTLTVWHGKGDKKRIATIYGDVAVKALEAWQVINGGDYVFPPLTPHKGSILKDVAMSYRSLRTLFEKSGLQIEMLKFSPHDARHTLIEEVIRATGNVKDAQEQAGHSSPSTTLRYAHGQDAVTRRKTKLRYG